MKYLKLLVAFTLMIGLVACSQVPIFQWISPQTWIEEQDKDETDAPHPDDDIIYQGESEIVDEIDGIDKSDEDDNHETHDKDDALDDIDEMDNDKEHYIDEVDEANTEIKEENEEKDEETENGLDVIEAFNTRLPEDIPVDLKYDKYPISYDYLLMLKSSNIRQMPSTDSSVIGKVGTMERIALVAEIKGEYLEQWDSDSWYQVEWYEDEELKTGFIFSALAEVRHFQFQKMAEAIAELESFSSLNTLAHISNYKNRNGIPPKIGGKTKDPYGNKRSQSAAGYEEPDKSSKFRYIPDGTLLQVLEKKDGFTKVKAIGLDGEYWVQDKYVNTKNSLKEFKKAIIVDRRYQNQGVFELIDGKWTLIAYGLSTTGRNGPYSFVTPLGYYMAIEKKDRFLYYKDGTTIIDGYAPYAVRFSGGGYIHGVPVKFKIENGSRIDPGMREFLHSIGTTPQSHMCIRNYTSLAKFIHGWVDIGETAIIVIE